MSRSFGPTFAAGTKVVEKEAGRQISPAATGTTLYIGQMEKGNRLDANGNLTLNDCPGQSSFIRKCGTFYEGSELPDAAFDFFNLSGGAGRFYGIRVTDGLERESIDHVWNRVTGQGENYFNRDSGSDLKSLMLTVTAKNGGRWGGALLLQTGTFTTGSDLTETTLATGITMLEDEFKGAALELGGVTTRSYTVLGNTTAGVMTVESDSTMGTDLAADTPADETYALRLDTVERQFTATGQTAGARQALSLMWKDGEEDATAYFGLDILVDGAIVRSYNNLSLDSADKWYIGTIISEDPDNDFIDVEVNHAGSITATNRPASWQGEYKAFSGSTLTAKNWAAAYTLTNSLAGFVSTLTLPAKCVRQRLTLTFTSATEFDITSNSAYGLVLGDTVAGTVGTVVTADNDYTPTFTVQAGQEVFTIGDTIVIDVVPFPVDLDTGDGLLSGYVYVDTGSGSSIRVQIESNTPDQIVFKSNPTVAPTPSTSILTDAATTDIGTAITFPTPSIALDLEIVTDDDGYEQIAVGGAVYANMTALLAALNGAVASVPPFFVEGTADTLAIDGSLYTVDASNANTGKASFIHVITSATAEQNIIDDTYITGTVGDSYRVQAPRELQRGYDGSDPSDADYIAALNTALSPINRLRGRNVGLVKIACPGVTATAVQRAGLSYAAFRNYQFRVEIPSTITSEASAIAYINDTIGRSDYGVTAWPSYGYLTNPKGNGVVLQTLTGAIHGREAGVARDFQGFHKAAAGQSVTIPNMIKSPLGEALIEEEITNPQGIQAIKKLKGNFVIWGDRTISLDPAWKWKHQREYMSHIEAILLENFDFIVFAINDSTTQSGLITTLQAFFFPEWQKRALRGDTFAQAVGIKIDEENNTNLTRAAGDLNAEISLRLADTVERFIITVGKLGVFDQIG